MYNYHLPKLSAQMLKSMCFCLIVRSLFNYHGSQFIGVWWLQYSTDHGVQTWVCDEGQEYQSLSQPVRDRMCMLTIGSPHNIMQWFMNDIFTLQQNSCIREVSNCSATETCSYKGSTCIKNCTVSAEREPASILDSDSIIWSPPTSCNSTAEEAALYTLTPSIQQTIQVCSIFA